MPAQRWELGLFAAKLRKFDCFQKWLGRKYQFGLF